MSAPLQGAETPSSTSPLRVFARDEKGAVYVEFLIAFLPVLVFFLCLLQLALLFTTKLYVEHASVVAARSAAVMFGDDPQFHENSEQNKLTDQRMEAVRRAAVLTLAPLILDGTISRIRIVYPNPNEPDGKDMLSGKNIAPMSDSSVQLVRVRVEAATRCKIAFADRIACGGLFTQIANWDSNLLGGGLHILVRGESFYPYQGASYKYEKP